MYFLFSVLSLFLAGYYGFLERTLDKCVGCPLGKNAALLNGIENYDQCELQCMDACLRCVAGRFSEGGDSTTCRRCPTGWYQEMETGDTNLDGTEHRNIKCQSCQAGTFSDTSAATNQTACQPCGVGRFSTKLGANRASEYCLNCPKGRYGDKPIAGHVP